MTDQDVFYKQIAGLAGQIQAELAAFGYQGLPGKTPARVDSAFGAGSMSFTGWLWDVFLPRMNEILCQRGDFPAESNVGTQAIRELDAFPEADRLVTLLCEIDHLVNGHQSQI
jgi:uncharacterized protein YqcC (DUF446 family)